MAETTTERRALVIGVNSASFMPSDASLTTPASDAFEIAKRLTEDGNFNVQILLNQGATKQQVDHSLDWVFPRRIDAQTENIPETSLLFFSGYGAGLTGYTGADNESYKGDLVTNDFKGSSPEITGISLSALAERVLTSPVGQKLVWLDSDYSGRFIKLAQQFQSSQGRSLPDCQYCFLAASGENEAAYDNRNEHGVFTQALLESFSDEWRTKKQVSSSGLTELFRSRYVTLASKQLGTQRPVVLSKGDIILFPMRPPSSGDAEPLIYLRQLSGYSPDVTSDHDLIGIDRDVQAFATLIAAQSVDPPLSIGVFGEWGSGKTFFMHQLRQAIAELALEAQQANQRQCELAFYKRIVQIEFNAWQYVEGNLWASLVEHIFENLKIVGESTVSEQLRRHLIDRLRAQENVQVQAAAGLEKAKIEAKAKKNELSHAKAELKKKQQELDQNAPQLDVRNIFLESLRQPVSDLLAQLGFSAVGESAKELQRGLSQARSVLNNSTSILTPLIYAKDRRDRWKALLMSLVVAPIIGWMVGMVPALLGAETIATITTLAGGAITLLATMTRWLSQQTQWLNKQFSELWRRQAEYEQQLQAKLAENKQHLLELEQAVSQRQRELQNAQRQMREADRQVAEMQTLVDRADPAQLLADFIEDRVASDDYRRHLGLLALIHNDFKQLSELMEEENWRLAPSRPDDARVPWTQKKYADLASEQAGESTRINRIVLYIDDLDRCPPNKVVDVLQAIHLLLAFPLFVVVVGVDARWITRSLQTRYRRLLHGTTDQEQGLGNLIGKATPHDYLEKIFQIPFWLQPMDEKACKDMVQGLLAGQVEPRPAPEKDGLEHTDANSPLPTALVPALASDTTTASGTAKMTVATTAPGQATTPEALSAEVVRSDAVPAEAGEAAHADETPASQADAIAAAGQAPGPERSRVVSASKATSLLISHLELQFIEDALTPLLGRSPRALKRFINVYRLIKAQYAFDGVARGEGQMSDYQAILFLLAMDTGTPDIAPVFFQLLLSQHDLVTATGRPSQKYNLGWLLTELRSIRGAVADLAPAAPPSPELAGPSIRQPSDGDRLEAWLGSPAAQATMAMDVSPLFNWAGRVVRYSFHGSFERG